MVVSNPQSAPDQPHRLHKPGVAGSSPAAASQVQICHTPAHIYHMWEEVSCSQLKTLRESPLVFSHRFVSRDAPPYKSDALDYGTLLHSWAEIGEHDFWERVVVAADSLVTATGALSKKADEWLKSLDPGLIPLSPADRDKLRAQTNRLLADRDVRELLESRVDAEFNVRWQWNGHKVRCRVDGMTPSVFFDWKTTRDKAPSRTWFHSVKEYGYHLQSAMYQSAMEAMGMPSERMRFIVTSTVWPHECFVCVLPERLVDIGRRECLRLLDELQQRLEFDCWSRLDSQGVCELYVPEWAMREDN